MEHVPQLADAFFNREPLPPIPKEDDRFLTWPVPQDGQTALASPPRRMSFSKRHPHCSQMNS